MNKSSFFMIILFFSVIGLAIFSFNSATMRISDSTNELSSVSNPVKISFSDRCDDSSVNLGSFFPPTLQPGNCCTAHSQCWSGNCACTRGGGSATRCCHLDNRRSCNNDAECQSNNCDANTGRCVNNPITGQNNRPSGAACSVHEDCQSGFCTISTQPGGVVTYVCR